MDTKIAQNNTAIEVLTQVSSPHTRTQVSLRVYLEVEWLGGILGACLILSYIETLFSEMVVPIYTLTGNVFKCLLFCTFSTMDIDRLKSLLTCYVSNGIFLFQFMFPQFPSVL